uniref:proline--tRNA ligase n=1 Tax=Elaeophora elaphi TaxID=1147741 RepID=A0A0R3RUQ2_9BILA
MDKKARKEIIAKTEEIMKILEKSKIRVDIDLRDNYSPGWKFNHWELKGVPIRLELGPRDIKNSQVTCVIRYNRQKSVIPIDNLSTKCSELLDEIHSNMYTKLQLELFVFFPHSLHERIAWQVKVNAVV